jgi:hypothetical protein
MRLAGRRATSAVKLRLWLAEPAFARHRRVPRRRVVTRAGSISYRTKIAKSPYLKGSTPIPIHRGGDRRIILSARIMMAGKTRTPNRGARSKAIRRLTCRQVQNAAHAESAPHLRHARTRSVSERGCLCVSRRFLMRAGSDPGSRPGQVFARKRSSGFVQRRYSRRRLVKATH